MTPETAAADPVPVAQVTIIMTVPASSGLARAAVEDPLSRVLQGDVLPLMRRALVDARAYRDWGTESHPDDAHLVAEYEGLYNELGDKAAR